MRFAFDSADLEDDEESDTVFAYQALAGASLRANEFVSLYGGYRYFATADPNFGGVESDYQTTTWSLGSGSGSLGREPPQPAALCCSHEQ